MNKHFVIIIVICTSLVSCNEVFTFSKVEENTVTCDTSKFQHFRKSFRSVPGDGGFALLLNSYYSMSQYEDSLEMEKAFERCINDDYCYQNRWGVRDWNTLRNDSSHESRLNSSYMLSCMKGDKPFIYVPNNYHDSTYTQSSKDDVEYGDKLVYFIANPTADTLFFENIPFSVKEHELYRSIVFVKSQLCLDQSKNEWRDFEYRNDRFYDEMPYHDYICPDSYLTIITKSSLINNGPVKCRLRYCIQTNDRIIYSNSISVSITRAVKYLVFGSTEDSTESESD